MKSRAPLFVLSALSMALTSAYAVDTAEWKCETCPYPKGASGSIEAGVGAVSKASPTFGDETGLQRKGAYAILGGDLDWRGSGGAYGKLSAVDLGLASRRLDALGGLEGLGSLRLAYSELPRHFGEGAQTPYLGSGGPVLTLPAGYPASSAAAMPLATTLQAIDLGYDVKRLSLAGNLIAGEQWTTRIVLRHDVRDGTRIGSGSFFATASQFALPVDEVTDQLEVGAAYATRRLQLNLAYVASAYSNNQATLTWSNPFLPVVAGASKGQLALAPDNQFHQVVGSAGYEITPAIRASGDFAVGRMTQDASYLATTLTPGIAARLPALPRSSLDARVDTFSSNLRVTATPADKLRLQASWAHDVRDNRTPIASYPAAATDIFATATPRSNHPYSFWQDRIKASADYRGIENWQLAGGIEQDNRKRSYQEVVDTQESTVWGRASLQARENLGLSLKLAHADRSNSTYGTSTWITEPDNPLLRKYNLAGRLRDSGTARIDWSLGEKLAVGLSAGFADESYKTSAIGLVSAQSSNLALDVSYALSERTQLQGYWQGEQIRSRQAGSETFSVPDWSARNKDRFEIAGVSVRHAAIPDKLDLGADLSASRAHSDVAIDTAAGVPQFPTNTTAIDRVRLYGSYRIDAKLSITASYVYEKYSSADWRLDGVLPATVGNLLALGQVSPNYRVDWLRVALRYRF